MSTDRIAVIDLETTGLSPWRHDRIVEIGIVVISPDGTVHHEYESLVNPARDIGPTSIHRITAGEVVHAPGFEDLAGDVLEILAGVSAVAGHNVGFDSTFLVREYERMGVTFPQIPLLCTTKLFGRVSLAKCCDELGITPEGTLHRAIADARATAQLVAAVCGDDPQILEPHRLRDVSWPMVRALKTPCYRREHAVQKQAEPSQFLQRIAANIHHDVDAEIPNVLAYMALIDRVLEDRRIDSLEENLLVDAASNWKLSASQLDSAHAHYLHNLCVAALADGVVTDSERHDMHLVARLLGRDVRALDAVLAAASAQLATARGGQQKRPPQESPVSGRSVCFTGELRSTINGQPIRRDIAETLASSAGMVIASNVTRKLDLLVVADPDTQSGKAKKARDYGVRVVADNVFWRMIGVTVD